MSSRAIALLVALAAALTGCSVSVRAGHGDPQAERAYISAIQGPMDALTAASSAANDVCAGGAHEDPATCYANTQKEILAVEDLQAALESVPTPERFATANSDLLKGLEMMAEGLAQRNRGLADQSSDGYQAGLDTIDQSLTLQKDAFAEYPADVRIEG